MKRVRKYTYLPQEEIEVIETKSGQTIKSKEILDGNYVKAKPAPKKVVKKAVKKVVKKYAKGGEMIPNPKGSYVPIRNQGIWGVQKRVNGEFETFFAVENKNGFDISNDLSKKVNENNEKATFSFWVKDGINAENFISKYLKGYEIEEDEDNRVNVFDLEIVFGKFLSNKSQVKD